MGKRFTCVDAWPTHDWEADFASQLANGIVFWIWYLPGDLIRSHPRQRWQLPMGFGAVDRVRAGVSRLAYPLDEPRGASRAAGSGQRVAGSGGR